MCKFLLMLLFVWYFKQQTPWHISCMNSYLSIHPCHMPPYLLTARQETVCATCNPPSSSCCWAAWLLLGQTAPCPYIVPTREEFNVSDTFITQLNGFKICQWFQLTLARQCNCANSSCEHTMLERKSLVTTIMHKREFQHSVIKVNNVVL